MKEDYIMKKSEKTIETLNVEISTLTSTELHDLFLFFYKINHQYPNLTTFEKFYEFMESLEKNPFRVNDDKNYTKQFAENLIAYTDDHFHLITAIMLIKKKFTVDEIIENFYSNVNVYDNNLF
jgi:hypothetical protein